MISIIIIFNLVSMPFEASSAVDQQLLRKVCKSRACETRESHLIDLNNTNFRDDPVFKFLHKYKFVRTDSKNQVIVPPGHAANISLLRSFPGYQPIGLRIHLCRKSLELKESQHPGRPLAGSYKVTKAQWLRKLWSELPQKVSRKCLSQKVKIEWPQ